MDFGTDYWHSMDDSNSKMSKELRIDPHQIGISHGIGEVGEGLKANIFRGATMVELGFFGRGKGFRSQPTGHTPESYGKHEREEMRQLAKINEVELQTHAAPDLAGGFLSGYNPRSGSFSKELSNQSAQEVKRAIDFAADVAEGGPIVFHTAEFPRPLTSVPGYRDKTFEAYEGEAIEAPVYFVDKRFGTVQGIRRDQPVYIPEKDKNGQLVFNENGEPKMNPFTFDEAAKQAKKLDKEPFAYYFEQQQRGNLETARAMQEAYNREYQRALENKNKFTEMKEQYEQLMKTAVNDSEKLLRRVSFIDKLKNDGLLPAREGTQEYAEFYENPTKFLKEVIKDQATEMQRREEGAVGYGRQIAQVQDQIDNVVPIAQYGKQRSSEEIAKLAMYAYDVEKKKNLKKPLWVAPENWTPEEYGAHPQEFRQIILDSRKQMTKDLMTKKGLNQDEAKKIAADHIKGTFDVGHMNFWKKYFKGNDREFKQWYETEVEKLAKEGLIGNVHLSDNFGYFDEHLEIGEGSTPIQPFVKKLKEAGYKGKYVAEPGGQKEGHHWRSLPSAWRSLGSPMYRVDSTTMSWSDIDQSYFGRAPQSPYFVVGDFAPSKDWSLWSETPLE